MEVLASAVFLVCLTQLTQLSASSTSTKVSLDEGRILVSWSYDEEADKLSFVVNASTVGWVGFGFAGFAPNKMQDYDLILAGYKEGRGYIFDMYSTDQSPPPVDSSQDYHLVMAKEDKGRTILHVERAANTGDAKDIQFTADSEVFFVWALHSSVDATDSSHYPFHDHRGSSEAKHLIFQANVPSKSSKNPSLEKTPPLTSSAAASIMPAATSSYDTITGRDVVPSSADGYEFKATELSIALLQTVVTPLDSPSEARSSSISQTHLSQQIPVSKQFLAPDILQLSSSPNSSLNSTSQKSRSIYSDSSNDEKAGKTDEFNEDRVTRS